MSWGYAAEVQRDQRIVDTHKHNAAAPPCHAEDKPSMPSLIGMSTRCIVKLQASQDSRAATPHPGQKMRRLLQGWRCNVDAASRERPCTLPSPTNSRHRHYEPLYRAARSHLRNAAILRLARRLPEALTEQLKAWLTLSLIDRASWQAW